MCTVMLSGFLLVVFLIGYIWWPLLEEYLNQIDPEYPIWRQIDWLLIGNFLGMSILIMFNADLKHDIPFLLISLAGGYIIESWGTLSGLWTYYTFETPPLWIIPAWPIAALAVKRMYLMLHTMTRKISGDWVKWAYWLVFGAFYILLLNFIWPTITHPLTVFALIVCAIVILAVQEMRSKLIVFLAGGQHWAISLNAGGRPDSAGRITQAAHHLSSRCLPMGWHRLQSGGCSRIMRIW